MEYGDVNDDLKKIGWLITKRLTIPVRDDSLPPYGDVTELNSCRRILDAVGRETLADLACDVLNLLQTSLAVYERNGDYAFGTFTSGWCRLLDAASRELCGTSDNQEALNSGKWLCHACCWNENAKVCMEQGRPVDIACVGGIHLYGVPIFLKDEVIGCVNIGWGNPPDDPDRIQELAEQYHLDPQRLQECAASYERRPDFLVDITKEKVNLIAKLIGTIVEHKEVEKQLKDQEVFTRAVMDHLPVGIAVNSVSPQIKFMYMNDRFAEYYRVSREALETKDFWEAVYPDAVSREAIRQRVLKDYNSGDPQALAWEDVAVVRPDETFFISAKNIPIPGSPLMISTVQDTTAHKRAELALRESEANYRLLFENMNTAFALHEIVLDENGAAVDYIFLEANAAFEEETGLKREEVIGRRVTQVLPEITRDSEDWIGFLGGVALSGQSQSIERYSKPLRRWYAVVAYRHKERQVATVFYDITSRKKAEEEIVRARTFFNTVINAIADPVFVKDARHRWIMLNDAFCVFMRLPREALVGKSDYDFFPKEQADIFWQKDDAVLTSGQHDLNEENFTDAAGVTHEIATKKTAVFLPGEAEPILVGIIRDITDIRREQHEKEKYLHEMEVFYKASIGREERILELKKQVDELKKTAGA